MVAALLAGLLAERRLKQGSQPAAGHLRGMGCSPVGDQAQPLDASRRLFAMCAVSHRVPPACNAGGNSAAAFARRMLRRP